MNATIDTTANTNTTNTNLADDLKGQSLAQTTAISRPVPGGFRTRARRFTLGVIAATIAILGGAGGLLPASQASAQALVTPYFSLDSTVTCDQFRNTARVTVTAGPQPAYRGMTVQFQTYVAVGNSASWGSWSSSVQLWNHSQLLNVSSRVQDGVHVRVWVQMRYWNGRGWSAPQGTWATPYMISAVDHRTPYYNGFCVT